MIRSARNVIRQNSNLELPWTLNLERPISSENKSGDFLQEVRVVGKTTTQED